MIRIKFRNLVLWFLCAESFLIGLVEYDTIWKLALLVLFVCTVASGGYKDSIRDKRKTIAGLGFLLEMFIVTSIFNKNFDYFIKNLYTIFPVIIALLLLDYANAGNTEIIDFLVKKKNLLNFIWLFSLLVLSLQVMGYNFLLKDSWLAMTDYREDLCNGIFGPGGSHRFTLFACVIFLLNYYCLLKGVIKNKFLFTIYTIATQVWMALLSTMNDNNSYFIFISLFVIFLMIIKNKLRFSSKNILIFFIAFITFAAVWSIPQINRFITDTLFARLKSFARFQASGSNERFYIPWYAFKHGFGWILGKGFSTAAFDGSSGVPGMPHFGINSFGTLVYLCGIWVYFMYTWVYLRLFNIKTKNRRLINMNGLLIILISLYTLPYWDMVMSILIYFSLIILREISDRRK